MSYTLHYFNARAKAEPARLLFALANVKYVDRRITFEEWGALKPTFQFGFVPVLEAEGEKISQSHAINRYLANKFGLNGSTAMETARVDIVATTWGEVFDSFISTRFGTDESKALSRTKLKETVDKLLPVLEKILTANPGKFYVSNKATYADLFAYHVESCVNADGILDAYPALKEHMNAVAQIPAIAEWIKKRPVTDV